MDKVDQLDEIQKQQKIVAAATGLQRFLDGTVLQAHQIRQKVNAWFFENIKREISSRLAVLEAYFTTANEFDETENVEECLNFLNDECQEIQAFIESFADDEEGGMEDA